MDPRTWTTRWGIAFCTGVAAHTWVGFWGHAGAIPDPPPATLIPETPPHLEVINAWEASPYWFLSGTIGPYVSLLPLHAGHCQTVEVRFAGDIDGPHSVWRCWHPADTDGDGDLNSRDIAAFLTHWVAGVGVEGWQSSKGDFNLDFRTDSRDISEYLNCWIGG